MKSQSVNPKTGEVVAELDNVSTSSEVADACAKAADAAVPLNLLGRLWRARLLLLAAEELAAHGSDLIALADRETGLGSDRFAGELKRTCHQFRMFAEALTEGSYLEATLDEPADTAMGPRPDLRRMLVPLGPVAVFGSSNFPLAFSVPGGDTASALAAGCPVVIKAHPAHPATSALAYACLESACTKAGAPTGTVGMVSGYDAGRELVVDSSMAAVAFTGSEAGGRALMQLAESREVPIPFFGELGSINPLVVSPSAARRRGTEITRDYLASITLGAGQFCTKPALAFVPSDSGEEIKSVLAEALSSVPQMFLLTEAIQRTFEQGVQRLTDESGIERVAAARVVGPGYEVSPAVFWTTMGHFRQKFELLTKECFGPSAVLVTYDDPREVICALKSISGTLTMSLHAEAEETEFAEGLLAIMTDRAGRIVWNGFPTGVAVSWAMTHGGPWPATTSPMHTSVGATAIRRFLRPVTFQDVPGHLLPVELRDGNPAAIPRRVNGILTTGGELT